MRGFRNTEDGPRTPEPTDPSGENEEISSPQKPRLKLKRRVVSNLAAPTRQFLASVAAADVPILSIEEPQGSPDNLGMVGIASLPPATRREFLQPNRSRVSSPPKTPVRDSDAGPSPGKFPSWTTDPTVSSDESSADDEFSRPSTARSTQTTASLFSRFSQLSADECVSPNVDSNEGLPRGRGDALAPPSPSAKEKGKSRKAPWTKAMSDHVWSTYLLYLEDPCVTPLRMGKSVIPPEGVCIRVAREAKRSWKGSKAARNANANDKSGSTTPTAGSSGTFIQWPHTCAATRAHLRALCRLRAASGASNRFKSRSPTPFTQAAARQWNRRSTSAYTAPAFGTRSMTMSLAMSTSESMHPQGPLAELTSSAPEYTSVEPKSEPEQATQNSDSATSARTELGTSDNAQPQERPRLGSPFVARSYGPSSSGSVANTLDWTSTMPRRQTLTVGNRPTLQSPMRFSRPSTQKRRHTQSSEPRKRPGIVTDFFDLNNPTRPREATSGLELLPRTEVPISGTPSERRLPSSTTMPNLGQAEMPMLPPPRLGSPFSGGPHTSFSFPNRMHNRNHPGSVDLGILGRPFATIQQVPEPDTQTRDLAGRLAYVDQRLKELRDRGVGRRSGSPT